ncbi:energy-coupling factor transporter ATPase [Erysipelotrichaceae bacterium RD49]|nr:energy-coupling factor transporter ATPase [Erysipelotrichaceae bacterium RD49]
MEAIALDHLSFSYDGENPVLKNLSLTIPKGSYTAIVGHNGSGKSTLAKLIIGLLEPGAGQIKVLGQTLSDENLSQVRDHVGIVFQNPDNQFIGSTVADDIAFGLENHCVPTEDMQAMIEESAAKVGMSAYLDAEPTNLSGGQKQRVAIAGILAMAPDIIIFDESTSMLDPQGKASVNAQIRKLNQEKNITILSITHDMEEASQAEQVVVLDQGEVAAVGRPEDVFMNEELMSRLRLELPFALKAAKAFQKAGLNVSPVLSTEALVEELCPSK